MGDKKELTESWGLDWQKSFKFTLMECYLSGNKKCGYDVQNMLAYGGKLCWEKAEGIRGHLRGCVLGNCELHVNRTHGQGEEQYLAFCARCCEGDTEIHQGLPSVHSDARRKKEESHSSVSKLEKMACCERCTEFSLSAYQREVKCSLIQQLTFTRGLDVCSAQPSVTLAVASRLQGNDGRVYSFVFSFWYPPSYLFWPKIPFWLLAP